LVFCQLHFALIVISRPAVQKGAVLSVVPLEYERKETVLKHAGKVSLVVATLFVVVGLAASCPVSAQQKPNVVILMTDDTGWNDCGAYGGGANLGHATPNVDRAAAEGALFTSWYGLASRVTSNLALST
jgi:hypothetical protein